MLLSTPKPSGSARWNLIVPMRETLQIQLSLITLFS
jgi:hypothetical protein